jgi:hypothetical protein
VGAPNDVEVLVNNGNLTNRLSSNQAVSDLFKSPSKENLYSTNNFSLGCLRRTEFTLQKALAQVEGNLEAGLFQQSMDWYLCCCCFFNFSLF